MLTVHKYVLDPKDPVIEVPHSGHIRSVHMQRGALCVWIQVDTGHKAVKRRFVVVGTGDAIPTGNLLRHVGTAFQENAAFVWHVYEVVQ